MGAFLDIFFPPACAACARVLPADAAFCDGCQSELTPLPSPHCAQCAEPGEFAHGCDRCRNQPRTFEKAYAPFIHEGAVARAIHQFKYEDHPELARPLGRLLAEEAARFLGAAPEMVCAIPLHVSRLRERKYDQAALLAGEVARLAGKRLNAELLVRSRKTERQVGLADAARASNMNGAFRVEGRAPERVLLIDDVLTTGATANAAAAVLRLAGAKSVQVLTLARAYSAA